MGTASWICLSVNVGGENGFRRLHGDLLVSGTMCEVTQDSPCLILWAVGKHGVQSLLCTYLLEEEKWGGEAEETSIKPPRAVYLTSGSWAACMHVQNVCHGHEVRQEGDVRDSTKNLRPGNPIIQGTIGENCVKQGI